MTTTQPAGEIRPAERRRRPRGAVRAGLVAAGLELARTGGPDAVVLREATRMVGVVPNAAYRHFADRDELLAAVCAAAMGELADRMAADVARVPGPYGDPAAARRRLGAIGRAYLEFARQEPGLFATAFAVPQQHAYGVRDDGTGRDRTPLGQLRTALDELVEAGVLRRERRDGIEYPIWSAVHGLAVLTGSGPLRDVPDATRRRLEELTLTFIGEGLADQASPGTPGGTPLGRRLPVRRPLGHQQDHLGQLGPARGQPVPVVGALHDARLAQFGEPVGEHAGGHAAAPALQLPEAGYRPGPQLPEHAQRPSPAQQVEQRHDRPTGGGPPDRPTGQRRVRPRHSALRCLGLRSMARVRARAGMLR